MSDEIATVGELKQLVENFVSVREWQQFHTPRNLSKAIAIEASELMDLFNLNCRGYLHTHNNNYKPYPQDTDKSTSPPINRQPANHSTLTTQNESHPLGATTAVPTAVCR